MGRIGARIAGEPFCLRHFLVDYDLYLSCFIVEHTHYSSSAWLHAKMFLHAFWRGEGDARTADLGTERFGVEMLVSRHDDQVETRFLVVAQENALADLSS